MERISNISRETKETRIQAALWLSGGPVKIDTGIGFFDHMLHAWAFYAGFGLTLTAKGDLEVDGHHTVEDTGIVLGQALREALGDKVGIRRFGSAYVPMDEALAFTALDFSAWVSSVLSRPGTRSFSAASGKAPTPGSMMASARSNSAGSLVMRVSNPR